MRTDAVRRSLQPPYTGPHKVLSRSDKNFVIEINGKSVKISIDRLKPCYQESTDDEAVCSSTTSTSVSNSTTTSTAISNQSVPILEPKLIEKNKKKVTFDDQPKIKYFQKQTTTKSGRIIKTPKKFLDLIENCNKSFDLILQTVSKFH